MNDLEITPRLHDEAGSLCAQLSSSTHQAGSSV